MSCFYFYSADKSNISFEQLEWAF